MEDLLLFLLGIILDSLLEVAGEAILALLVRAIGRLLGRLANLNQFLAGAGFALLGIGAGFLSLVCLPHPLVHSSRFHGISLLISPIITGFVMSLVGRTVRSRGRNSLRIESFGYGFIFALGMAVIRLHFAK